MTWTGVVLDDEGGHLGALTLTPAEVLIVKWFRGDRSISAEQLQEALAGRRVPDARSSP